MKLRKLELRDVTMMLEWMHDRELVENLQTDFTKKTEEDCCRFVEKSWKDTEDIHLAIANEQNEYMGTVSLKHIDCDDKSAEFAIVVRRCAMRKGYAEWGMKAILQKGFEELQLRRIYWCVGKGNQRALRFYRKNSYPEIRSDSIDKIVGYTEEQINQYIWFQVECL